VLRLGKFSSVRGPGLFFITPVAETVAYVIDLRTTTTTFRAEETMTSDTVPVDVDAVLFWRASKKSIPLDDVLIEELLAWRRETPYAQDSDYVFASTKMRGKQPYWMSRIMQHHIKPVAAKTGIDIKGWHTLRHSYTTLLRQNNNNNPKVVQGLLRHASYSITMNVYDEAMSEEKRNAHRGVIQQLNRSVTRSAPKPAIPQVVVKVWRPRRDLNPCYRRERALICCITL